MNLLNQIMSYDKTKVNQEKCVSAENADLKNQIVEYPKLSEEEIERIISERYLDKDDKTKTFIKKALKVYGNKFDYSKTVYIKATEKVLIECKNKHCFSQTPHDHLSNHGCSKCGGTAKLTQNEFIKKANEIHGEGRYNYSKSIYCNMHKKICIICNNHETPFEFQQSPHEHLKGQGCPQCYGHKKLTTEKFIKRAKIIHGDKYNYSEVNYIDYHTKICIICTHHKKVFKFWQTPHNHLIGNGCPKCNSSKGEIAVRNFLINNKIKFEEQKTFKDCKYKNKLRFDFYIPSYNLCIEYDGRQHFKINHFKFKMSKEEKLENFKLIQLRDQIKNEYCKNNNINLIRIRYDEDIEEKLMEYFQNHKIINKILI